MDGEFVTTTAKVPWGPAAGIVSLALSLAATTYNLGRAQQAAPAPVATPVAQVTQAAQPAQAVAQPMPLAIDPNSTFASNVRLAEAQARGMSRDEMLYGVPPANGAGGILEIKPTGRSRPSTVGPAPEPPKQMAVGDAPARGYHDPYFGAPLYQAPNYYERACYSHASCRGYSRCQYGYGSSHRRAEPLIPFGPAGHKSDTSYGSSRSSVRFNSR